jgi:casein kinase 1
MDRLVGGHYRLRRRIGAGSFGEIYAAEDTTSHRRVAAKLENSRSKAPQLAYESKLYGILAGGTGIPRMHWYGSDETHNIMVIDLLGKSLEDHFTHCRRRLSLKTVLMVADQMLTCVEYIHSKGFIHRDIKPDNFVMGLGSHANQVFIIDYGLAKKYRDQHTHAHIPYVEGKSLTGTARYASVAAQRGCEQSRRDDLESLGFVWVYLLRGSLPWMGLASRDEGKKYENICEVKSKTPFSQLCHGFPAEFVRYFETVRTLKFTEKPNYSELRRMFRNLFVRQGFTFDYKYDWVTASPIQNHAPNVRAEAPVPDARASQIVLKPEAPKTAREDVPAPCRKSAIGTARRTASKEISRMRIQLDAAKGAANQPTSAMNQNGKPTSSRVTSTAKGVSRWLEEPPKFSARRALGPGRSKKTVLPPWMTQSPLTRRSGLGHAP